MSECDGLSKLPRRLVEKRGHLAVSPRTTKVPITPFQAWYRSAPGPEPLKAEVLIIADLGIDMTIE